MSDNILQKYKLERSLPLAESRAFELLLKKVNQSFVVEWEKKLGVKAGKLQYYDFEVYCPMRNFADAYARIGSLWQIMVLPIWKKRHKKKPKKTSR